MSRVKWIGVTGSIASGTSAKTLAQLVAASNHRALPTKIKVWATGGASGDPPALLELVRQTTAGTMSNLTLTKVNEGDDETLQTTAQHTSTGEPTLGAVLRSGQISIVNGYYEWNLVGSDELPIKGAAGLACGSRRA